MASWHPDTPELDFKKPREIAYLERLDDQTLNAMDQVEVKEHIDTAAYETAKAYHDAKGGNYEDCVLVVSTALSVTGNSIGGKVGALLVARSDEAAKKASQMVFPEGAPINPYGE